MPLIFWWLCPVWSPMARVYFLRKKISSFFGTLTGGIFSFIVSGLVGAQSLDQAMSELDKPNFKVSGIPSRFVPAAEVTDGEYRAAISHRVAIFMTTALGIFFGWFVDSKNLIVVKIPIIDELTLPIVSGFAFYLIARYRFPKASQLKTPPLRLYPEYRRFKLASDAFAKNAKANSEKNSD